MKPAMTTEIVFFYFHVVANVVPLQAVVNTVCGAHRQRPAASVTINAHNFFFYKCAEGSSRKPRILRAR